MNNPTLGSKLRELREARDMSLRELAKRIGVSAPFLSDIELGRRFPAPDKIDLLARALGVEPGEFKDLDFRDEVEKIKNLMFADQQAGLVFRSVASALQQGVSPKEIADRLRGTKK